MYIRLLAMKIFTESNDVYVFIYFKLAVILNCSRCYHGYFYE